MSRCYSHQEIPLMETSDEQNPSERFYKYGKSNHSNLVRTPSLPPCLVREELNQEKEREKRRNDLIGAACLGTSVAKEKEDDQEDDEEDEESEFALAKLIRQASITSTDVSSACNSLVRAPSLPSLIGKHEKYDQDDEDEHESELTMGKLIRQASLGSSGHQRFTFSHGQNLGHQSLKEIAQSSSIPKQSPRQKSEVEENTRTEHWNEMMRMKYLSNPTKVGTSSSEYHQFEQVRGCMNPIFTFDKKELNEDKEMKTNFERQRPLQRSASAIPSWDDNKSAEDLKAQIKFWARAVASNVR